jgi:hypothetical protein
VCRFFFEREPLGSDHEVALSVFDRLPLEEHPEVCSALGLDEMPRGAVDEPAPIDLQAVQNRNSLLLSRQTGSPASSPTALARKSTVFSTLWRMVSDGFHPNDRIR